MAGETLWPPFSPKRGDNVCMYVGERESYHHPPSLTSCWRHQVWILSLIQYVFISEWHISWAAGVSSSQASDQSWQIICFSFSPSLLSLLSPFLWLLSVFLLGLPTRWQHQSLSEVGLEAKGDFWGRLVWEHSRLVLLDSISTHINVMGVVFHACTDNGMTWWNQRWLKKTPTQNISMTNERMALKACNDF